MKLPGSNIKKFLIFRLAETRKKFFIFQETENGKPEKLIIFREMEIFNPSSKNKKIHPEKISYGSRNGNPTPPPKKIPLFQEKELSYIFKETETLESSYISGSNLRKEKNEKKKPTLKKFLIFRGMELSSHKLKKLLFL